jgi:hypothetical protein
VATATATALGSHRDTGFILNGVKIDPGTGGSCNDSGSSCTLLGNAGQWSIEALAVFLNFSVDANNAHVQPGGVYHYHGMPEGFVAKLGKGQAMTLVGWAADGFPDLRALRLQRGHRRRLGHQGRPLELPGEGRARRQPSGDEPVPHRRLPAGLRVRGRGLEQHWTNATGARGSHPVPQGHLPLLRHRHPTPYLQRCVKGSL